MAGRSAGKMQGLHGSTGKMQTDKRKVLAGSGGGDDFVTMSFSYIYMYLCRDNPQWGGLAEGRRAGINFDAEAVPQASVVQGAAVDSVLAQLENAGAVGAGEGSHGTKEPCATMALVTGPGLPALSKKIVERIRSLISRSCPQQKAGAVQSLRQALEGQVMVVQADDLFQSRKVLTWQRGCNATVGSWQCWRLGIQTSERQIQVTSMGRGRWSSIRMDAPGRVCMRNVSLTSLAPWKTGVPGASQLTTLRRSVPSGPPLAQGLLGSIKRLWAGAAGPQRSA